MKYIKYLLFLLLLIPVNVFADHIYNIEIDAHINSDGSLDVSEVWDAKADSGTEWYKNYKNLENSDIINFKAYIDNELLQEKNWNIDESLTEKAGFYGIIKDNNSIDLCVGKKDFERHKIKLNYTITNSIFTTEDAQVLYITLFPKVVADSFNVTVTSDTKINDNLDVWGFGHKGYTYVLDNQIKMSNEENTPLDNNYVVLLAKFPKNSFNTNNKINRYEVFDDVLKKAKEGSYKINYDKSLFEKIMEFLSSIIMFIPFIIIGIIGFITSRNSKYGFINNKIINKDTAPMFRDIPCNKDIYKANALIKINNFSYKESNILGAIILKWVKEDKIIFKKDEKDNSCIDLTKENVFSNDLEKELFMYMKEASQDGVLENKELEKWCRINYKKFLDLLKRMADNEIDKLKNEGHIYIRKNKEECKYKNVLDDSLYEESKKIFGLREFLNEFGSMDDKETLEVKVWDEYLMFAYLFGIADKVADQLKKLYPKDFKKFEENTIDYTTIYYINSLSTRSVNAASSARRAAENYSSGGGGFSFGGGGGGSFGSGGSMGGR